MKIVFFGTPNYVVPLLDGIHKRFMGQDGNSAVVAVVTASPKPAGRALQVDYSPVDKWAHKHRVPTYYDASDLMKDGLKADLGVLESYGSILSTEILRYFPHGIINAHPSLLPKYRGSSPAQATLLMGDSISGGTVIKLDEKIDHGPIITQFKEPVTAEDTAETLRERIFLRSVDVMLDLLEPYVKGKINLKSQNDEGSSMTWRIKKDDTYIPPRYLRSVLEGKKPRGKWIVPFIKDFEMEITPESLERFVRAMNPWPGAWTGVKVSKARDNKLLRLKILKTHVENSKLILDMVQLEGKNPVTWQQLLDGYPFLKLV